MLQSNTKCKGNGGRVKWSKIGHEMTDNHWKWSDGFLGAYYTILFTSVYVWNFLKKKKKRQKIKLKSRPSWWLATLRWMISKCSKWILRTFTGSPCNQLARTHSQALKLIHFKRKMITLKDNLKEVNSQDTLNLWSSQNTG